MSQYLEQLGRTKRLLAKIQVHDRPFVEYDDDIWSFFQNCWHLKDWLKNDVAVPAHVRTCLEQELTRHPDLMVCADLANATKHLELKNPRAGARHDHKNFRLTIGGPSSVEYSINRGDGTRVDAVQLAKSCVDEWILILKNYGLPSDV